MEARVSAVRDPSTGGSNALHQQLSTTAAVGSVSPTDTRVETLAPCALCSHKIRTPNSEEKALSNSLLLHSWEIVVVKFLVCGPRLLCGYGRFRGRQKGISFSPLRSYSGPDQLIPGRQSTVFPQNKAHGLYHAIELVGLLKKKMFNFSLTPTLRCLL